MAMKMRLKIKSRSRRCDINGPKSGHEHNTLNIKCGSVSDGYMY